MTFLKEKHFFIVKEILEKYPYTFYIFGSRTKETSNKFSDLDLCFMEEIPLNVLAHIDEDFEESDLPFKVDVIDYNNCEENFKSLIQKNLMLFKAGPNYELNPNITFPIYENKSICFLKNIISKPYIEVGEYTYYRDEDDVMNFEKNVILGPLCKGKLIIGKFCQIERGVCFLLDKDECFMNYPFEMFSEDKDKIFESKIEIGNNVRICSRALLKSDIVIGDGSIIEAGALIIEDVPSYSIVRGNPAKIVGSVKELS